MVRKSGQGSDGMMTGISDGSGMMTGICDGSGMESGLGDNVGVVVSDNGSSLDLLDDGVTLNGSGHFNGNGFGHMDGSGHLNDSLDVLDHIIGDIVGFLNGDGLVNGVDLLLDLDNSGVDGLGALQGGGHGDLEVGDGGFQDLGGVSGDVGGLSQMNLFGDDGSGLVDGSDVGFLSLSHVGGGKRDGGGGSNGSGMKKRGVSQRSGMSQRSSMHQRSGIQEGGGRGRKSGGKQGRKNELKNDKLVIFWGIFLVAYQGVHFVCFVRPEYFQRCN